MTQKIKCPSCEYEWETNAKLNMVTCPNCQRKVDKKEATQEKQKV